MKTRTVYYSNGARTYYENGQIKSFRPSPAAMLKAVTMPSSQPPTMEEWTIQAGEYLSGYVGVPIFIDRSSGQLIRHEFPDEQTVRRATVHPYDPLCAPTIKKPITQARINKAFGLDQDESKSLAAILKKAQRHL